MKFKWVLTFTIIASIHIYFLFKYIFKVYIKTSKTKRGFHISKLFYANRKPLDNINKLWLVYIIILSKI